MVPLKKFTLKEFIGKGPVALAHLNFLTALSSAMITSIWAIFLNSFVDDISKTGIISGFLSLVALTSYFILVPLFKNKDRRFLLSISLMLFSIIYFSMYFLSTLMLVILFASFLTIVGTFRVTSFTSLIKSNSSKKELNEKEGLSWTFVNLGWLLGPLIAGYLSKEYGLKFIFLISSFLSLIAFLVFSLTKFRDGLKPRKKSIGLLQNISEFFKDKRRIKAYILTSGTSGWWMLIYIFVPIHLIQEGIGIDRIGYFLLLVALPLVIFEHSFGKLSGRIKFKKIFLIGFFIPAILSIIIFFTTNLNIILFLLILSSIGMAMIEPNTETYFLKFVKDRDATRFLSTYSTSRDIGQIITKFIPALFLVYLPFNYVFFIYSVFMFIMFFISLSVKE